MRRSLNLILLALISFGGCETLQPESSSQRLPHSPLPVNGALGVDTVVTLSWSAGELDGAGVQYGLLLGSPHPDLLLADDLTITRVQITSLQRNKSYAWRVFASDGLGRVDTSETWYFTTGTAVNFAPNPPSSPLPKQGNSDVSLNTSLHWIASDPDGDELSYDVYFARRGEPLDLIIDSITVPFLYLETLEPTTTYLWSVRVRDGSGVETDSPVWSFTTMPRPQKQLAVTLQNDGTIGDPSGENPGVEYPAGSGMESLALGGFWIGAAGPGQMPLSVSGWRNGSDFLPSNGVGRLRPPVTRTVLGEGTFEDDFAFDDISREEENLGVYVEVHAELPRAGEGSSAALLLRYRVMNYSELARQGVVAGWFLDFDVYRQTPRDDRVGYDPVRHFAYISDEGGACAGIALLPSDAPLLAFQWWTVYQDPQTREEIWQRMNGTHSSSGGRRIRTAPSEVGDYRLLLTAGPIDLAPWETVEYRVALSAGGDLRDLSDVIDSITSSSDQDVASGAVK